MAHALDIPLEEKLIQKFQALRDNIQGKYLQAELEAMKGDLGAYFHPYTGEDGKERSGYVKKFKLFPELKAGALIVLLQSLGVEADQIRVVEFRPQPNYAPEVVEVIIPDEIFNKLQGVLKTVDSKSLKPQRGGK